MLEKANNKVGLCNITFSFPNYFFSPLLSCTLLLFPPLSFILFLPSPYLFPLLLSPFFLSSSLPPLSFCSFPSFYLPLLFSFLLSLSLFSFFFSSPLPSFPTPQVLPFLLLFPSISFILYLFPFLSPLFFFGFMSTPSDAQYLLMIIFKGHSWCCSRDIMQCWGLN